MSKLAVMVTSWLKTIKNAYLATRCAKLATMILHSVFHHKLAKLNSKVDSSILVQQVW